jgi:hypothetical protein
MKNRYDEIIEELYRKNGVTMDIEYNDISEEELKEFESKIGSSLPADYREFISRYGDAIVMSTFRLVNSAYGYGAVGSFEGINSYRSDLAETYVNDPQHNSRQVLQIGSDDYGLVFLSLREDEKGTIYFIDTWEAQTDILEDNLIFAANSFDEFIQMLLSYIPPSRI